MSDKYELEKEYYKKLWVYGRTCKHADDDIVPFMDWTGDGLYYELFSRFGGSYEDAVASHICSTARGYHEYYRVERDENGELHEVCDYLFGEWIFPEIPVETINDCFTEWFFRLIRAYIVYCDAHIDTYYGISNRETFIAICLGKYKNVRAEDLEFFKGRTMSEVINTLHKSYEYMFEYVIEHSADPEEAARRLPVPDYLPAKVFAYVHWLYNHDDGMILLPV